MAWGEQKTSRANMSILLVETDDFFNHEEDEFSRMRLLELYQSQFTFGLYKRFAGQQNLPIRRRISRDGHARFFCDAKSHFKEILA